MKRFAAFLLMLVGLAAAAARWLDVVNYTDLSTGFVTYGPYWVRYAVAAGVLALGAVGAFMAPRRPAALAGCSPAQGFVCFAAGFGFAALGGAQLADWAGQDALANANAALYLVSAVWLLLLGRSRFTPEFEAPTRSALFGVAGTLSLYLLTLRRFGFAPTGMARVGANLEALAALAALLFCAAQAKVAYLPGGRSGGWVFFTGFCAFALGTCLALPGALAGYMAGQTSLSGLIEAVCLGLVGACGMCYAFGAVGPAAPPQPAQAPPAQEHRAQLP